MLKTEPPTASSIGSQYTSSNKWSDPDFSGTATLTDGFTTQGFENNLASGSYYFARLPAQYPNAGIFDSQDTMPEWREPKQGGAGTCYIMSAMGGVGEFPQLIKDAFVTDSFNDAGIIEMKLYIRGKPWLVTIDDEFLFQYPGYATKYLVFAQPDNDTSVLWAPILEKAWAKVKGSYATANGGFVVSGIGTITGAPVFHYDAQKIV
mmetsp:Transcript_214/g.380  ORF Transcript_214/g.380 Transcript_214/m.380 type:complete len:206 (+) Transcript_214:213-830(+)